MLRMSGSNGWQEMEISHAISLEIGYSKLNLEPRSLNSEDASHFLAQLERFAEILKVKAVDREYRTTFTRNYKRLFRDHGRQYRFEIMQAFCDECPLLYINGIQHTFSEKVIRLSKQLKAHLRELGGCLQQCKISDGENMSWCKISDGCNSVRPPKFVVVSVLGCLDRSWADFESQYVNELISMEAQARNPLKAAVKHAKHIPEKSEDCTCHKWCAKLEKCREHQKMLFERIAELNVMANVAGKGRGDLNVDVLNVAVDIVTSGLGYEKSSHLVRSVCEDLLDSFAAMSKYLCTIENLMELVDPVLKNNSGLVERLADLEEAWETVARYVNDGAMRCSMDAVFGTLQRTRELEPAFQQMCSDCDVELFLIIPRIVLLSFLINPGKNALLKLLLPNSFADSGTPGDLHNLLRQFESIVVDAPEAIDNLILLAIHGPGAVDKITKEQQGVIRTFMRELERWSIELQRCQARDWNTFCAVLVQHLSNDCKKNRKLSKRV